MTCRGLAHRCASAPEKDDVLLGIPRTGNASFPGFFHAFRYLAITFSDKWQDFLVVEWQATGSLFGMGTSTRSSHSGYPKQACTISVD